MNKNKILLSLTNNERFFLLKFFNLVFDFRPSPRNEDDIIDADLTENLYNFIELCELVLENGSTVKKIKTKLE